MARSRPTLVTRSAEALVALLAPALPLIIVLLGVVPAQSAMAEWLLAVPALLAALLLLGRPRRRRSVRSTSTLNARTPHGLLD
ncbi:MAG: hypothetical protein ACK4E7_03880 [Permianibacter sp.]